MHVIENKWKDLQITDIRRGQHLYVERMCGAYHHHGIVIYADDIKHIQTKFMSSECSPLAPLMIIEENRHGLRVVNIDVFCNEEMFNRRHEIHRVRYGVTLEVYDKEPSGTCYLEVCVDEDTIISNALNIFNNAQEQDIWKNYNLVMRNCEQFAYLCCTNIRTLGEQVYKVGKVSCFGLKIVASHVQKLFKGCHLPTSIHDFRLIIQFLGWAYEAIRIGEKTVPSVITNTAAMSFDDIVKLCISQTKGRLMELPL